MQIRHRYQPTGVAGRPASRPILAEKKVAIIGAGPAGVLTAAHMARLGARVDVYEAAKREDLFVRNVDWNIRLNRMSERAIADAGLSTDKPAGLKCVHDNLLDYSFVLSFDTHTGGHHNGIDAFDAVIQCCALNSLAL
jgi:2-polyprenyl-6-methoxyphenol hydroxylase-like FAD-dependent oxidoreductase